MLLSVDLLSLICFTGITESRLVLQVKIERFLS